MTPASVRNQKSMSARLGLLAIGLAVLMTQARSGAAAISDPLSYDRGFLLTGNYAVGGVDFTPNNNAAVNGVATGTIGFNADIGNKVPDDADIVAAYLYWEAIYVPGATPTAGATFRGFPIDPHVDFLTGPDEEPNYVAGLKATTLTQLPGNTGATCWGAANSPNARLTMFRADVLHLLPKLYDSRGIWTGRLLVNDYDLTHNADLQGNAYPLHTVTLPEKTGDSAVQSAGATLLVVYRKPSEPLTKIVLYENDQSVFTPATTDVVTQTLRGFYEHAGNAGKLTHIVGSGGNNQTERLYFNNSLLSVTNAFPQTSPSSDRSWGFPTVPSLAFPTASVSMTGVGSESGYGETVTAKVDHLNASPNDCLAWAAIIFSTPVLDEDHDGLPDAVENSSTAPAGGAWKDPDDQLLPDLHAMQASPLHRDMFVEIGAMKTTGSEVYGSADAPYNSAANPMVLTATVPQHNHMPLPEVLKMVGDAYKDAPPPPEPRNNTEGIRVHFDVGPDLAATYAAQIQALAQQAGGVVPPDAYIVQVQPRGGEVIVEAECEGANCQFPAYRGTVGWRLGLELLRDAPVGNNGEELTTDQLPLWQQKSASCGGVSCTDQRRRFDPARRPLFHYLLYAHARGKPKSFPCLSNGLPAPYPSGTSCSPLDDNPAFQVLDYHVPSSTSGVADLPGGSGLITLGLWDQVAGTGSVYAQAATTFHELGHQLNLWHGGKPAILGHKGIGEAAGTATYIEPNCKPNYLSTMSYLFQVHGLIDTNFALRLDYARAAHNDLDETAGLRDDPLTPVSTYRPTWFAPANSALAQLLGVSAATRLCNGVKFNELFDQDPPVPTTQMARVWAPTLSAANDWNVAINWNGDADVLDVGQTFNANFDGAFGQTETLTDVLYGFNDWDAVRLDQIGAGLNVAFFDNAETGPSAPSSFVSGDVDPVSGDVDPVSGDVDPVSGDVDPLSGDFDPVSGDVDPVSGDVDPVSGDVDPVSGDVDPVSGAELDFSAAKAFGRTPPNAFTVCILGGTTAQNGCTGPWVDNNGTVHNAQPTQQVDKAFYLGRYATWTIPSVGTVTQYIVVRQKGTRITSLNQANTFPTGSTRTSWVDTDNIQNNQAYTYAVRGEFGDETPHQFSGVSNYVTVKK